MKIYVAGPYSSHVKDIHDAARVAQQNVDKAIRVGIELIKKGHYVFIPHLTHYVFLKMRDDEALQADFWYKYDMAFLDWSEALFFIAPSRGANKELKYAKLSGKTIFYNLDDVPSINAQVEK